MLSDEEKKAIERIEDVFYQDLGKGINKFQKITLYEDSITDIRKLLNLIEKQSKEIEELKDFITKLQETKDRLDSYDKENTLEIEKLKKEIEELKKDKLELINKNHVVHLKDVEKELREMRKEIDTKNAEIECLNVIHESYKENIVKIYNREGIISEKEKEITKLKNEIYDLKKKIYAINLLSNSEEE